MDVVLMDGLAAHGASEAEFMTEALDSFRAHRSASDKLAVEEARFHLLEYECVPPRPPRLPRLSLRPRLGCIPPSLP